MKRTDGILWIGLGILLLIVTDYLGQNIGFGLSLLLGGGGYGLLLGGFTILISTLFTKQPKTPLSAGE
jgi:hypothetical protein